MTMNHEAYDRNVHSRSLVSSFFVLVKLIDAFQKVLQFLLAFNHFHKALGIILITSINVIRPINIRNEN